MKHYFKYAAGYINLDSESIYLTNSGNWQEARGLQEKGKATIAANNYRILKMKGFIFTLYIIIVETLFDMVSNFQVYMVLVIGLGILAYYILQYFKSDFGVCYKIPLAKISTIEKHERGLKINFMNAYGEPDFEIVDKVDAAGIKTLTSLKTIGCNLETE
ncbi:hypothetical protein AAEO56_01445 [Flavobacterium sp. DGU11]|uniref:Uncharacterized protein n=1 Tax=Flavobacterium arundinis TaxID=3139143 RepID=A0ABU9HRW8_9FLAO